MQNEPNFAKQPTTLNVIEMAKSYLINRHPRLPLCGANLSSGYRLLKGSSRLAEYQSWICRGSNRYGDDLKYLPSAEGVAMLLEWQGVPKDLIPPITELEILVNKAKVRKLEKPIYEYKGMLSRVAKVEKKRREIDSEEEVFSEEEEKPKKKKKGTPKPKDDREAHHVSHMVDVLAAQNVKIMQEIAAMKQIVYQPSTSSASTITTAASHLEPTTTNWENSDYEEEPTAQEVSEIAERTGRYGFKEPDSESGIPETQTRAEKPKKPRKPRRNELDAIKEGEENMKRQAKRK
jgi:uncharacterized protein (UPF0333 family)